MPATRLPILIPVLGLLVVVCGCAEGLFWKTGYLSPWVREQWSQEEQIAESLITKRKRLQEGTDAALAAGPQAYEQASQALSEVVAKDPILLVRIEAIQQLANFPTETADRALALAATDRQVEIRRAAVRALGQHNRPAAVNSLIAMAQSDADVDIRVSATSALANYPVPQAQQALANFIQDPNPAVQLGAAESLAAITGESFGGDIQAWQQFLQVNPPQATNGPVEQIAQEGSGSSTR